MCMYILVPHVNDLLFLESLPPGFIYGFIILCVTSDAQHGVTVISFETIHVQS